MVTTDPRPASPRPAQLPLPRTLDDVPGWFWPLDQQLFGWLLKRQTATGLRGDLLELGSYLGRSAILLGRHLQPGEVFTICDLFDSDAPDGDNAAEMTRSYRQTLTRAAFEHNYLAFHPALPTIVQAPTSVLADGRIATSSCRFVHIDASHLYEHVALDIRTAGKVLAEHGIVVLDDFRSPHTPGVAAATWEAVFEHDLHPLCVTPEKLYGTWADPEPLQEELLGLNGDAENCYLDVDVIAGQRLVRFSGRGVAKLLPAGRPPRDRPPEAPPRLPEPARTERRPRSAVQTTARRLALDLLPPVATRAVRRHRQATRDRQG
ncbi:class I SAM-dependent methyltransferase [Kitasatospora sp. NPDC052896]|uniref:class I SAM-dependent methyltransferase n=1 Tax=Kitasatospora sp. NPDC052896 TaxID=3364061 RepID=UPI0037C757A6